jgi:RNA recognition motif-containing protein
MQSSIRGLFEQYGSIVDLQVVSEGALNQAAYITYSTKESCVLAIRNLNNVPLMHG